jgi:probable HAF family extracellular repeat protein
LVLEELEGRRLLSAFSIADLGTLGGASSRAYAINDTGDVVGEAATSSGATHAFLFHQGMHDLGTFGATDSSARAINNAGTIVGWAAQNTDSTHAFAYYQNTMHDLGSLGGYQFQFSQAFGINKAGKIVGESGTAADVSIHDAVQFNGGVHQLAAPATVVDSYAQGINSSGAIVGWANTDGVTDYAFLRQDAAHGLQNLGTLGGPTSRALAINSGGVVVGWADVPSGTHHAFGYVNQTMVDLGMLGGTVSEAYGINDAGVVVGTAVTTDGAYHAFAYFIGMADLNTLIPANSGWELIEARSINSSDQIVGVGMINGQLHAFLMTPTPPPAPHWNQALLKIAATLHIQLDDAPHTVTVINNGPGSIQVGGDRMPVQTFTGINSVMITTGNGADTLQYTVSSATFTPADLTVRLGNGSQHLVLNALNGWQSADSASDAWAVNLFGGLGSDWMTFNLGGRLSDLSLADHLGGGTNTVAMMVNPGAGGSSSAMSLNAEFFSSGGNDTIMANIGAPVRSSTRAVLDTSVALLVDGPARHTSVRMAYENLQIDAVQTLRCPDDDVVALNFKNVVLAAVLTVDVTANRGMTGAPGTPGTTQTYALNLPAQVAMDGAIDATLRAAATGDVLPYILRFGAHGTAVQWSAEGFLFGRLHEAIALNLTLAPTSPSIDRAATS